MTNKKFSKEEWAKALENLQEAYKIFVPVKDGDFHTFKSIDQAKKPDFNFKNKRLSPKSLIYPQSERMLVYSIDENESDANTLKEAPKIFSSQEIVGIRPCDAYAFQIVKINFDNPRYRDPWWVQRFN